MGTRFLASPESAAHPDYMKRLVAARESDTVYEADLYNIGWSEAPHRVLRNKLTDQWLADGRPGQKNRHRAGEIVSTRGRSEIRTYQSVTPHHEMTGEIDLLPMWCGQSVGQVDSVEPVNEIIDRVIEEAKKTLLFASAF